MVRIDLSDRATPRSTSPAGRSRLGRTSSAGRRPLVPRRADIFAALLASTTKIATKAIAAARRHGLIVSCTSTAAEPGEGIGGRSRRRPVNVASPARRRILRHDEDFSAALGFARPRRRPGRAGPDAVRRVIATVHRHLRRPRVVATTLRVAGPRPRRLGRGVPGRRRLTVATPRPTWRPWYRVGVTISLHVRPDLRALAGLPLERAALSYSVGHQARAMTTPATRRWRPWRRSRRSWHGRSPRVDQSSRPTTSPCAGRPARPPSPVVTSWPGHDTNAPSPSPSARQGEGFELSSPSAPSGMAAFPGYVQVDLLRRRRRHRQYQIVLPVHRPRCVGRLADVARTARPAADSTRSSRQHRPRVRSDR